MEEKKYEVVEETVEFSEELYQKNIQENEFSEIENGLGGDEDENN